MRTTMNKAAYTTVSTIHEKSSFGLFNGVEIPSTVELRQKSHVPLVLPGLGDQCRKFDPAVASVRVQALYIDYPHFHVRNSRIPTYTFALPIWPSAADKTRSCARPQLLRH